MTRIRRQGVGIVAGLTVALLLVVVATQPAAAATEVDQCREINASVVPADGVVQLNTSIADYAGGTCFPITTSDVVFDGMGNVVDGDDSGTDYGFNVDDGAGTATNVTVRNVTVQQFDQGARAQNTTGVTFSGVTAVDHGTDGVVSATNDVTIVNSVINGQGASGDGVVVATVAAGPHVVRNTEIRNHVGDGISADSGAVTVDNVTLEASGNYGVNAAGLSDVTVQDSTVRNNDVAGIYSDTGGSVSISATTVTGTNGTGIDVRGTDGVTMTDVTALENNQEFAGQGGIAVNDAADVRIESATVRNNPNAGLLIRNANRTVVADSRITENCGGNYGLMVSNSHDVRILRSNVSNNTGVGMQVFSTSPNLTVEDTKFNGNGGLGGYQGEAGNTLTNVTANGNDNYGIRADDDATLTDVEVSNNGDEGLRVGANATLSNVVTRNNRFEGLITRENATLSNVTSADNGDVEIRAGTATGSNVTVGSSTINLSAADLDEVNLEQLNSPSQPAPTGLVGIDSAVEVRDRTMLTDFGPAVARGSAFVGASAFGSSILYQIGNGNAHANLTVSYTDAAVSGVNESTLALYRYDSGSSSWVEVPSTVDTGANTVQGNVTTSGEVAVFGDVDAAPTARLSTSEQSPEPNERVRFDASASSDPDSTITQYEWDFDGDGTYDRTTTSAVQNYTYATEGAYDARVRVTANGLTDTATLRIDVDSGSYFSATPTATDVPSAGSGGGGGGGSTGGSGDGGATATATPRATATAADRADIRLVDVSVSDTSIGVGESVTVTVTVENVGTTSGTREFAVGVNGRQVDAISATLAANESRNQTVERTFPTAGEYNITVDGEVIATVVVTGGGERTTALTDRPTAETTSAGSGSGTTTAPGTTAEDGPGFGPVVALTALLAAALVAARRR